MSRNKANKFKHWQLWLLIAPALVYLVVFCYLPMAGIITGFQNYDPYLGIFKSKWVGFAKFEMLFSSYYFGTILKNTVLISLYSLLINTPAPIILALMINEVRVKWFKNTVQTITYAPYFISLVVLIGMCFSFMLPGTGPISKVLVALGGDPAKNLMIQPGAFKAIYVLSGVWQGLGWWSIIYVGTLSNVDPALHEAATLDGAGRLGRMFHINLPALAPTITIQFILAVGSMMSLGFEKVYLMQTPGTISASEIIATYTYKISFAAQGNNDFSFGTAVGLFNSVINLILLFTANFVARLCGRESLW